MSETVENKIPLKMHPRVFAALGADLVTNDIVAVIELVKNSYDAFASEAKVSFKRHEDSLFPYLEIRDNGLGMTKEVIDEVWCTVATPYKETHPFVKNGDKIRRVSGAKGLGRLAVARLGNSLRMITKSSETESWEVNVNWNEIASADSVSACYVSRKQYTGDLAPYGWHGTILQIIKKLMRGILMSMAECIGIAHHQHLPVNVKVYLTVDMHTLNKIGPFLSEKLLLSKHSLTTIFFMEVIHLLQHKSGMPFLYY